MEMKQLVERMRCPACGAPALNFTPEAAVCSSCQAELRIDGTCIHAALGETGLSSEWAEKQEASVERYQDEHYEEDDTIARVFGGFIAVTLDPDDLVFDVGCGLFETMPAYARDLRCAGYVGLEPLMTPVNRDYLCMMGAVAENLPLKDGVFDAILLATSLDHIERVDAAFAELKRILTDNGRIYIWTGLNEPEMIARAKSFQPIFFGGSPLRRTLRVAAAPLEYAIFLGRLLLRSHRMKRGIPLDTAHFRYYTHQSLHRELNENGLEVARELIIPGTNSILVEARPR